MKIWVFFYDLLIYYVFDAWQKSERGGNSSLQWEQQSTKQCIPTKGGQTDILVRWSAAQRTTEMLADQRTGKNSGPAPADYRNWASASPVLNYFREVI